MEKQPEIVYLKEEPDFREIQKIVGGYFTAISLPNKKLMYINEEGELKNLKCNNQATKLVGYTIYGRALIIG